MKARWLEALALTVGLAVVAGGAIAAEAPAKPGYNVWAGLRENSFSLAGTNGYTITVSHIGKRVELTASAGDAAAIYVVDAGRPSPEGDIEARLPGRGRVSVQFHPAGRPHRTPPFLPSECDGGGEIEQRGWFRGTIRFKGERDFTSVTATRARGFVLRSFREVCREAAPRDTSDPDPTYSLKAHSWSQGRFVTFTALRPAPGSMLDDESTYVGSSLERRHGMAAVRVAVAHADGGTFAVSGPPALPTAADVAPPPPFQGVAHFEKTDGGEFEWSGTLAVDLPGAERQPLTGSSFQATLCLDQRCLSRPIPAATRPWLAQGSGSQSQVFWDDRLSWSR